MSTYTEQAKKDYKTGCYTWHCLKRKYPTLTVREIFQAIFEVKKSDSYTCR